MNKPVHSLNLFYGSLLCFLFAVPALVQAANPSTTAGPNGDYIRVNQVGYLSTDSKIAIAFSNSSLSTQTFSIINNTGGAVLFGPAALVATSAYAPFTDLYDLNFSAYQPASPVTCYVQLSDGTKSVTFGIGPCIYQSTVATAVNFYRGQNCGTGNAYAGGNCHMMPGTSGFTADEDGMVADGPNKGTSMDVEGGIHDSGDWIKFMLTMAWVNEGILYSYQANPTVFGDQYGSNLQAGSNGVPDVLDEGRYILDWIIKMNPNATTFYYDVADGRDHDNFGNLPQNDTESYNTTGATQGTGNYPAVPNPYRAVYGGTNDQGGTNNAARAAGALAMGYQIWNASGSGFQDTTFAATCLQHAQWLYALAKSENYTQIDVDDFYPQSTIANYADYPEMEMAAVQLYKATGTASYLTDAQNFAANVGSAGGQLDWGANNFMAHLCLYKVAPSAAVSGYMRADLQADLTHYNAGGNPYGVDYAYGWGGMEDQTSSVFMCQEWKKLFPTDTTFDAMGTANRDWLLGRNPWGVCFIQGMGTVYPLHPQHNIAIAIYPTIINGGAIEGPCDYASYSSQGSILTGGQDQYTAFNNNASGGWVYHDDNGDYVSNEITSTQSMWNLNVLANLAAQCSVVVPTNTPTKSNTPTLTPTKTNTPASTNTFTFTNTRTVTPSATASSTPTASFTASWTSTATATFTSTSTNSFTATKTYTSTNTPVPPTNTSTNSLTPTRTSTPTNTSTVANTNSFTPTLANTLTATPSNTATRTNTTTNTSTLTWTGTPTNSFTGTVPPSNTPTNTVTPTNTATATLSATPSSTATRSLTPTQTSTFSSTDTATLTFTNTSVPPTNTFTASSTSSFTRTSTSTPTPTNSFTSVSTTTSTYTNTPTPPPTASLTATGTSSFTATSTSTFSSTATFTMTNTHTPTSTSTSSFTATNTPTPSYTASATASSTKTPTASFTPSPKGTPVVYPNPISGPGPVYLKVPLASAGDVEVTIYTPAFRKVNHLEFRNVQPGSPVPIPLENEWGDPLADGLYYLRVSASGKSWVVKLLILR